MLQLLEHLDAIVESLPRSRARVLYKEYAHTASETGDYRYKELANVYRHLANGHRVISINRAIRESGVHDNGTPFLAIACAEAKWVWFVYNGGFIRDEGWSHPASAFVSDYSNNPGWNKRQIRDKAPKSLKRDVFRFMRDLYPIRIANPIRARVPLIPPKHLPKHSLHNYQILWEADWDHAPTDPVLLRRISREFFVVEAEWDLSATEQLVLEMAAFRGE